MLNGQSKEAMLASNCVLLASGTATLEAALMLRPMIVAYKMATLSWAILSRMAATKFVSLHADRSLRLNGTCTQVLKLNLVQRKDYKDTITELKNFIKNKNSNPSLLKISIRMFFHINILHS